MNQTIGTWILALALAPLGLAQPGKTPQSPYLWTTIDQTGAGWNAAIGINSEGRVVGYAQTGTVYHSFEYRDGNSINIDIPGKEMTHAWGINARGDVVGCAHNYGQPCRGFLVSNGQYTPIQPDGATESWAYGINPRGDIVGYYLDANKFQHGFLFSQGVYTTIDVPLARSTRPQGINSRGQIAGAYTDAAKINHGFVYSDGVFTTIDLPGGAVQYLTINPQGDLAGIFNNPAVTHGFVIRGDSVTVIEFPGAKWTHIHGMNAAGEIVGMYGDQAGKTHGYGLLLPR